MGFLLNSVKQGVLKDSKTILKTLHFLSEIDISSGISQKLTTLLVFELFFFFNKLGMFNVRPI